VHGRVEGRGRVVKVVGVVAGVKMPGSATRKCTTAQSSQRGTVERGDSGGRSGTGHQCRPAVQQQRR